MRFARPPPHPATRRVAMRAQGPRLRGSGICATPCDQRDRGVTAPPRLSFRTARHSVCSRGTCGRGGAEHRREGRDAATFAGPPPRPATLRVARGHRCRGYNSTRHARVDVRVAAALVAAWRCGAPPGRAGRGNAIRPTTAPPGDAPRRHAGTRPAATRIGDLRDAVRPTRPQHGGQPDSCWMWRRGRAAEEVRCRCADVLT